MSLVELMSKRAQMTSRSLCWFQLAFVGPAEGASLVFGASCDCLGVAICHNDTGAATTTMKTPILLPLVSLFASLASAQQSVPFADGIPVAPELPVPPVPHEPRTYETAEGMDIRDGVLDPNPAPGIPEVKANRRSGLNDLALHPNYDVNRYVYFTYHKPLRDDTSAMAIARGRWNGTGLEGTEDVFVTDPGAGDRSRMVFGPDGTFYMSTAGEGEKEPGSQA